MPSPNLVALQDVLSQASADLPHLSSRRVFGCYGLFASGLIFALIWKAGRIGLKLPTPTSFEQLMALPGAEPWKAGNKTMSQWVLVPEAFHTDAKLLKKWVHRAHASVTASGKHVTKKGRMSSAKPAETEKVKQRARKKENKYHRISIRLSSVAQR